MSSHNLWEWSNCSAPSWITNNSDPFSSHLLNLIHNMFTQFISTFKSIKTFVSFQLSSFFTCTLSMIQGSCCNALNAAIVAMIAVLRGFLKIYCFSALICLQSLCKTKMSSGSLLKYAPSDGIDNIQCCLCSDFCVSADCVLMTFWRSTCLAPTVWVPVSDFRILLFELM